MKRKRKKRKPKRSVKRLLREHAKSMGVKVVKAHGLTHSNLKDAELMVVEFRMGLPNEKTSGKAVDIVQSGSGCALWLEYDFEAF